MTRHLDFKVQMGAIPTRSDTKFQNTPTPTQVKGEMQEEKEGGDYKHVLK